MSIIIRELIRESIRKVLNEKVYGKIATVFHGSNTPPESFIPILTSGNFSPGKGSGAMYGPGLYTVFQLRGSRTTTFGYGPHIYKLKINLDGFVVLSVEICKKVYGQPLSIKDQLKLSGNQRAIQKFENSSDFISRLINLPLEKIEEYSQIGAWDLDPDRLSPSQKQKRMKGSERVSLERFGFLAPRNAPFALELIADDKWKYIPGIIYTGDNDGLCALVYDGNAAVPLAHTTIKPDELSDVILADMYRGEREHDFVNIPKEEVRSAIKRVRSKGNTRDLIVGPETKRIRKYTYDQIKDLFNFPLLSHLQNRLHMPLTINERIDYILKNNPDIEYSIAALSQIKRLDIVTNSIEKSKQASIARTDFMIDYSSIIRLTEIFGINNNLELMINLTIFLMKNAPNELMGVIRNSAIINSDFHVCLFLIYYIENRVLLPARVKGSSARMLTRLPRRIAIALNIAEIEFPQSVIDLLVSEFKKNTSYFKNILQYHTSIRGLILNQTNNNKDYTLEILKRYAGFPIVFKQFVYNAILKLDPKIIEYKKIDLKSFNENLKDYYSN